MNELPRVGDLEQHQARTARTAGVQGVEQALFDETTDKVEIALYVKGRMIHTNSDSATVQRIMAILTGLGD
jgi:hypothetical protein